MRQNELFTPVALASARQISMLLGKRSAGGLTMQKRLRALLLGTEDAVPGDYILALVATGGLFLAVLLGMLT